MSRVKPRQEVKSLDRPGSMDHWPDMPEFFCYSKGILHLTKRRHLAPWNSCKRLPPCSSWKNSDGSLCGHPRIAYTSTPTYTRDIWRGHNRIARRGRCLHTHTCLVYECAADEAARIRAVARRGAHDALLHTRSAFGKPKSHTTLGGVRDAAKLPCDAS